MQSFSTLPVLGSKLCRPQWHTKPQICIDVWEKQVYKLQTWTNFSRAKFSFSYCSSQIRRQIRYAEILYSNFFLTSNIALGIDWNWKFIWKVENHAYITWWYVYVPCYITCHQIGYTIHNHVTQPNNSWYITHDYNRLCRTIMHRVQLRLYL